MGQLGNGQTDTVHAPIQPHLSVPVKQIDCGGYYTAVITESGQLVTFGCAKYGRLGTGDETDKLEPMKITCTGTSGAVNFQKVSLISHLIFQTLNSNTSGCTTMFKKITTVFGDNIVHVLTFTTTVLHIEHFLSCACSQMF